MILTPASHYWPSGLTGLDRIYAEGDLTLLEKKGISIVGTRHPSQRGLELTCNAVDVIGSAGYVIISGLASGIDGAAHLRALKMGFPTIAVIGTPIDIAYPKEHEELQKIIKTKGLVLSQFESGQQVQKYFFMQRNLTMAKIACSSLIVQDRDNGGAVGQVKYCERLKKPVFVFREIYENNSTMWQRTLKNPHVIMNSSEIPEFLSKPQAEEKDIQPSLF